MVDWKTNKYDDDERLLEMMKEGKTFKDIVKDEVLFLRHGYYGIEHRMRLFRILYPELTKEKIGCLDIETSNLQGDFGFIISYWIKYFKKKRYYHYTVNPEEIKEGIFDKNLLKQFIKDVSKFDRIFVYYGGDYKHDIPFLRTRALKFEIEFPKYRDIKVTDIYTIVKKKLNLHRNRLETACNFFEIPTKKHRLDGNIWIRALAGDKLALKHIDKHCREDVISLDLLAQKLLEYEPLRNTSI